MDNDVWDQMPDEFKQVHHCHFKDRSGTDYLIYLVESDTSRLEWVDGKGTCLNPALPSEYEIRVYEVEPVSDRPCHFAYFGLSGQFTKVSDIAKYYCVSLDEILASKVNNAKKYLRH